MQYARSLLQLKYCLPDLTMTAKFTKSVKQTCLPLLWGEGKFYSKILTGLKRKSFGLHGARGLRVAITDLDQSDNSVQKNNYFFTLKII
jgi:hypothetical protein